MARKYFGTDGIRGLANKVPMTSEVALRVGMAAGKLYSNGGGRPHRVVIGKDTRLSGYMIESALTSGFTAVGMDVFLLGPMPTPAVAMLTRSLRADLGVMISASHNPFQDNGIKLFDPDGYKLSDEAEARIEALIDSDTEQSAGRSRAYRPRQAHRQCAGALHRVRQAHVAARQSPQRPARRDRLCQRGGIPGGARTCSGNSGAEVINIGVEPNGSTSMRSAVLPHPEALCAKVREMRADIGIGLDGDADRVVICRREGPHRRRRPDHGGDRRDLASPRPAGRWRRRRHRDVQPGARALLPGSGA